MHHLATERRKAGKPPWEHRINLSDVWRDDGLSFEQKRDAVVHRIRASTWFKGYDESDDLPQFTEELAGTQDIGEFDLVMVEIYDIADADRVWIATF